MQAEQTLDFITTEKYTKDDVRAVQKKSIEMAKTITDILDKYGIEYIAAHGTLLGMVRHNGHYIPWDDDCDLFVFDWCYARAVEVLRRELPDDLIVHNRRTDPIYWCSWTKIRDKYSDTYESLWKIDRKLNYHGICIDLLRVKPMLSGEYKSYLKTKQFKNVYKEKNKNNRNIKYALNSMSLKVYKFFSKFDRKKLLIANFGTIIEAKMNYKDVFPLQKQKGDFEDIKLPLPHNPDRVLKSLYGNYMEIPPLEKRLPHFDEVKFLDKKGE